MMMKKLLMKPLMAPEGSEGGSSKEGNTGKDPKAADPTGSSQPITIDYDKLASLIDGKQKLTEDTVIKSYFKQQGLSGDEMAKAIADFKAKKAAETPDVNALQTDLSSAKHNALQANIERDAMLMASDLEVDLKTMPYLIKMAELGDVAVDGKIDNAKLKEALNKVLTEVPQLKKTDNQQSGFKKIGANGDGTGNSGKDLDFELERAFGIKKK